MRVVAVDWSGDVRSASKHIWLAEAVESGRLVRLESGRDRHDLATHLLSLEPADLVIGVDFAFSFPNWFLSEVGVASGPELWARVAQEGEQWLLQCRAPFWGRPGKPRPLQTKSGLRHTELAAPHRPKSIFQVGGAGAVGTGSIRGMPMLHRLHAAGARVWPFLDTGAPLVLEIYPRLFTGPVRKSNPAERAALIHRRYPHLSEQHRQSTVSSEDAFDAAVSALEMVQHVRELSGLPPEDDPVMKLEGRIWHPRWHDERA